MAGNQLRPVSSDSEKQLGGGACQDLPGLSLQNRKDK